jgi:flagellar motor switch protein FliG
MFTFEDLGRLDPTAVQALLRVVDKAKLPAALKGATETLRELFFSNMSERASKLLKEEISGLGPIRMRDVDEAQSSLVASAKDLAAKGEINISRGGEEEEMVY